MAFLLLHNYTDFIGSYMLYREQNNNEALRKFDITLAM